MCDSRACKPHIKKNLTTCRLCTALYDVYTPIISNCPSLGRQYYIAVCIVNAVAVVNFHTGPFIYNSKHILCLMMTIPQNKPDHYIYIWCIYLENIFMELFFFYTYNMELNLDILLIYNVHYTHLNTLHLYCNTILFCKKISKVLISFLNCYVYTVAMLLAQESKM